MKCSICNKDESIIHIHEYSQKGIRKINLCLSCAVKRGFKVKSAEDFNKLFENLIKNIYKNGLRISKNSSRKKKYTISSICPSCKTTINDLTENLRVGCRMCYSIFENIIDLLIYKQNKSLNYLGKLPYDLKIMKNDETTLCKLKNDLDYYIQIEDFNKAAVLRDEIKKLKKKIQKKVIEIANK